MTKADEKLYRLAKITNNVKAINYFESKITTSEMKNNSEVSGSFKTNKYSCEARNKDGKISYHFFDRKNGKTISAKNLKNIIG